MRNFFAAKVIALSACAMLSQNSWAMLINGNMDDTGAPGTYIGERFGKDLNGLNKWDVYDDIPGWTTLDGPGIEIQKDGLVVDAHSGDYYVELDSHGGRNTNSTMGQDIFLATGSYSLSFYYRGRTNKNGDDNGINAAIFNDFSAEIASFSVSEKRSAQNFWQEYTLDFNVATAGNFSVQFNAFGKDNTLGGFVDTIALERVPEPATLGLMLAGLMGVGAGARKSKT